MTFLLFIKHPSWAKPNMTWYLIRELLVIVSMMSFSIYLFHDGQEKNRENFGNP